MNMPYPAPLAKSRNSIVVFPAGFGYRGDHDRSRLCFKRSSGKTKRTITLGVFAR